MILTMQETYWAQAWTALVSRDSWCQHVRFINAAIPGSFQAYGARRCQGKNMFRGIRPGLHVYDRLLPVFSRKIRCQRFVHDAYAGGLTH